MIVRCTPPRVLVPRRSPKRLHDFAREIRFDNQVPVGLGRRDDLDGDLATVVRWERPHSTEVR